jgi:hypothetical protein
MYFWIPSFCNAQAYERNTLPVDKKAKPNDFATSKAAELFPELPGPFTIIT